MAYHFTLDKIVYLNIIITVPLHPSVNASKLLMLLQSKGSQVDLTMAKQGTNHKAQVCDFPCTVAGINMTNAFN